MSILELEDLTQEKRPPPIRFTPFALGFRPFFLGAAAWAVAGIFLWVLAYRGVGLSPSYFDPMTWHAHEMIFGFAVAVIAGFLLTAVPNWTGHSTPKGWLLALLFLLWLAGRVGLLIPGIPRAIVAGLDIAFLPALIVALVPALWNGKRRNWIFPGMLLGLTAANALVHAPFLSGPATSRFGLLLGLYWVLLMILVMAGRVFPFFTERALGISIKRNRWANGFAIGSFAALAISELASAPSGVVVGLSVLAAVANGWRVAGWFTPQVMRVPMLWILFAGYGWIVVGLALRAATAWDVSPFASLHALTVGGIGVICLGMISRVSRGHTGRLIQADRVVVVSFVAINLAAFVRVAGTLTGTSAYGTAVTISGGLWGLAFLLFLIAHTKTLLQSRPDGKPG